MVSDGSGAILDEAYDTLPHLWTIQQNNTSSNKLTVSGVGTKTAATGTSDWDFGTLFALGTGSFPAQGYISRLLVFNSALTESEIQSIQNYLEQDYNL